MRLALVGKGGAGKSVIAGTLARVLAREGMPVLAVDSDPLPGLSLSLGLGLVDAVIPDDAVEERPEGEEGPRFRLRAGLSATEAMQRYAVVGPDGVRFLQFGKPRGHAGTLVRAQFAFRQIIDELPAQPWSVIGDLPGGTRQPFFGWGSYADTVLVVVEPTATSMLSARRLSRLADGMSAPGRVVAIGSKVREDGDVEQIRARTGLEVIAAVPWYEGLLDVERRGVALLDHALDSPAAAVIASLARRLAAEPVEAASGGRG